MLVELHGQLHVLSAVLQIPYGRGHDDVRLVEVSAGIPPRNYDEKSKA